VHASGVYITPNPTDVRIFFVDYEPTDADSGDDKQPATVRELPHIQAEIIMGKELARWIRDYLNEYLKQPEATPK